MSFWGDVFESIGSNTINIGKLWGAIILVCAATTAWMHFFVSLYGCRQLLRRSWKWLGLPIGLTIYSSLNAFVSLTPLIFCILASYRQSGYFLSIYELSVYCFIMIAGIMCFSCGRRSIIHSM